MIAGRYSLDREIGRGGTGAVWLGCDELLGRQVALKRIGLLPGADHTDVARAEREARLSARLNHPHVVAVFDVVSDAPSVGPDDSAEGDAGPEDWWLVMEYVEGRTLAQLVQERGCLPPDEAAPILWQIADGLAAAHAEGITHRDVKPSNVLVDSDGNAKITDFGIARVVTDPSLTQTGFMTGSPAYLAPEVASGGRGDAASDVWSLGATAFHVLAGRPPYEIGDHVLGALYRIVNDEPPRLPAAGWLAPLLEGTMVKEPERRWSMEQARAFLARSSHAGAGVTTALSAAEVLAEDRHTQVLGVVATAPVVAAPSHADEPPAPAERPVAAPAGWRRSPKILAGLGAAAALVLVVVVATALSRGGSAGGGHTSGNATPTSKAAPAGPTARGMEAFIRDYVRTVADDPDAAWQMLTPKFQKESGGFERYRNFWDSATNGEVRSITADPAHLTVSYQVHFDHFDNGPGPTVLDLKYDNGRYLIDGEHTKGFVPAG